MDKRIKKKVLLLWWLKIRFFILRKLVKVTIKSRSHSEGFKFLKKYDSAMDPLATDILH